MSAEEKNNISIYKRGILCEVILALGKKAMPKWYLFSNQYLLDFAASKRWIYINAS